MESRLKHLQSRIPAGRFDFRHIATVDLEALEGHWLAAYKKQRLLGQGWRLPFPLKGILESYERPPRPLSKREIRRICKPPSGSTISAAHALKKLENSALAVLAPQPGRKYVPGKTGRVATKDVRALIRH